MFRGCASSTTSCFRCSTSATVLPLPLCVCAHANDSFRMHPHLTSTVSAIAMTHTCTHAQNHPEISLADLWAFAGCCGIEFLGGPKIPFKFGRKDDTRPERVPPNGRLPDASQGAGASLHVRTHVRTLHVLAATAPRPARSLHARDPSPSDHARVTRDGVECVDFGIGALQVQYPLVLRVPSEFHVRVLAERGRASAYRGLGSVESHVN